MKPKPKRCKNCRRDLNMERVYAVSGTALIEINPDKLMAKCPDCGTPFQWEDWTDRKKVARNHKIV